MEYYSVLERDRPEIVGLLRSPRTMDVIDGLLSAAYYDPDWRWVQEQCLVCLNHQNMWVRRNAATCLGHIARIHKELDVELVLPRLTVLKDDAEIGAWVQDALDDIRFQLRFQ